MSNVAMTVPTSTTGLNTFGHTDDPFLFKRIRTWWVLLVIILVCAQNGPFAEQVSPGHLLASSHSAGPESGGLYLLLTLITWTPFVALLSRYIHPTVELMLRQKAVLAFPVLALLSALWSSTPEITIRKAVLLFLAFTFGWFLAVAYSPLDQMRLFLFVGVILGLASVPMSLLLPTYGRDFRGEWKGVFTQKNQLGAMMFFLFSGLPFRRVPTLRKLLALASRAILPIGLMVMSQSKESLVSVAILIGVRLVCPFVAGQRREQFPFLICAAGFGLASVVLGYNALLLVLQRDATLSGRTDEWAVLIYYAFRHFWLGYGYAGFWNGSADSLQAIHAIKGSIHGADSGYLDTMLQLGVAGLALWVIMFLVALRGIYRATRKPSLPLAVYWYAGLIIAIFVLNFVGSGALVASLIPVVLAMSCAGLSNMTEAECRPG